MGESLCCMFYKLFHTSTNFHLVTLFHAAYHTLHFYSIVEANGGAKCVINDGALKKPDIEGIFGLHMMPDLPCGTIGIKAGHLSAYSIRNYIDCFSALYLTNRKGCNLKRPHIAAKNRIQCSHYMGRN